MSACPVFLDNHEVILSRQSAVTLVGLCVRRSEEVMDGIEWDWTMGVIGDGGSGGIVGIWSKELRL